MTWEEILSAYGLGFLIPDVRSWIEQDWTLDDIMAAISERADLAGIEVSVLGELLTKP